MKKIIIMIISSAVICMNAYAKCSGLGIGLGVLGGFLAGTILNNDRIYSCNHCCSSGYVVSQPTVIYQTVSQPISTQPVIVHPIVIQSNTTSNNQVVVTRPPVIQQVWIEGRYENQVMPDGVTLVRVWIPGHYENRIIQ